MRDEVIRRVYHSKIIAIVRGVYDEDCIKLARALYAGGIDLLEVTYDQSKPEDLKHTSDTISALVEELGNKMIFGAGTVTDEEMLQLSYQAGAQFIVSPNADDKVVIKTREYGMVSMPGAMTPSEIIHAYNCGADFVKVFPAANLGSSYIKALRGPINHIPLLAVGGINIHNMKDFLLAGVNGLGIGGNLVNKEWIRNNEFGKITDAAREYVHCTKE